MRYEFSNEITNSRTLFMGFAILLVLFFHAFCTIYNPLGNANIGYVGVDIFDTVQNFV